LPETIVVPVCTTTTPAAAAVGEAKAGVGLGDELEAATVGVGVELGPALGVDLAHAESRAIIPARATRPNRWMFMRSLREGYSKAR